jgi:multicomponent Na+:H+ antiporter subunit C
VAVSITALALCLIIEIYRQCGTLEADELKGAE